MMKVASGGELSRFLLALKVALADRGSAPTLVFDEIDTGVGGAVADAIGQRLSRLAGRVQVLSVTHAPQVAARAATHFLISKSGGADRVVDQRFAEMDRRRAPGGDRPHAFRRERHGRGARRPSGCWQRGSEARAAFALTTGVLVETPCQVWQEAGFIRRLPAISLARPDRRTTIPPIPSSARLHVVTHHSNR